MSDFLKYQKRAQRMKKLEELLVAVKEMTVAMRSNDPSAQHMALSKVYKIVAELSALEPVIPA